MVLLARLQLPPQPVNIETLYCILLSDYLLLLTVLWLPYC